MTQDNIKISVILSIFGNDGNLFKTLTCLSNQIKVPDELVIVNSLHQIEIDKIIEQFKDRLKINYIFSQKRLMPGGSRNLGLFKAKSPVVAFIDSKTFPVQSWLEDSIEQLNSSKGSIIFGKTQYKAHSEIQNIFVPVFFGLPNEANHFPPFLKIVGTTAIVSTLLIIVGHPYNPINAGKGGFNLG